MNSPKITNSTSTTTSPTPPTPTTPVEPDNDDQEEEQRNGEKMTTSNINHELTTNGNDFGRSDDSEDEDYVRTTNHSFVLSKERQEELDSEFSVNMIMLV